jgi:hypothetical protein
MTRRDLIVLLGSTAAEQRLQCPLAIECEVILARQQGVFLALDVTPIAACKPRVLAFADRIQGFAQMAHDVELVEQNRGLRRMRRQAAAAWNRSPRASSPLSGCKACKIKTGAKNLRLSPLAGVAAVGPVVSNLILCQPLRRCHFSRLPFWRSFSEKNGCSTSL